MKVTNKTNVRLKAVITRADGRKEDLGVIFDTRWGWWKKLWNRLIGSFIASIPAQIADILVIVVPRTLISNKE